MYRVYLIKIYGISIRSARCWKDCAPAGRQNILQKSSLTSWKNRFFFRVSNEKERKAASARSRLRRWMVVFTLFSMKLREAECWKHVLTDFHNYVQRGKENHRSYQKKEPESRYVNTDRFYVRSKTEMQRWQNRLANEHIIHVMQNLKSRDIRLQKVQLHRMHKRKMC